MAYRWATRIGILLSRLPVRRRGFGALGVSISAALLFVLSATRRSYPIGPDAAAYLYSGLVSARTSGITYRSVFDVKPPGIHLLSTGLHLAGFGREGTYLLSVLLMWLVFSAIAYLIGELVYGWTGDALAANVAPVVLLVEEATATAWMHGPMGKYIVALFTLGSVVLLREERPVAAVGVATVAAAFWQFAGMIPIVVLVAAIASVDRERQWRIAVASIAVAAGITAIVVAPYVLSGAGGHMIAQVIVISTVASQEVYGTSLYGWLSVASTVNVPAYLLWARLYWNGSEEIRRGAVRGRPQHA